MVDRAADNAATLFIHSIGDACLVVDSSLTIAACNEVADSLYAAPAGTLAGSSVLDRCPESEQARFVAAVASCNGTPSRFVTTQRRADGTEFEAELTAATCRSADHLVTLIVRDRVNILDGAAHDDLVIRAVALENALDGVVVHTLDGELLYANRAACGQWGVCDAEEVRSRGPFGWIDQSQLPLMRKRLVELEATGEARFDTRGGTPTGGELNIEVHARLVDTPLGRVVVSTARDITERIQTEEMVRYLAYHDMLTGLGNRVRLGQELAHEISAADRHGDVLGVIFIDLNDFKPVNDTYGHTIGDHVLREVADRLVGSVRESDTVARLGGDEFVVVLPRLTSAEDLPAVAQKLSEEISRTITLNGQDITVSATVGMAIHHRGEDADSLLIRADLAMYDAREQQVPGWELFVL